MRKKRIVMSLLCNSRHDCSLHTADTRAKPCERGHSLADDAASLGVAYEHAGEDALGCSPRRVQRLLALYDPLVHLEQGQLRAHDAPVTTVGKIHTSGASCSS